MRSTIASSIAAALIAFGIGWKYSPQLDETFSPCIWGIDVVDGDTIKCHGVLIRLEGIDTAEIRKRTCDAERELGIRAKTRVAKLLIRLDALPVKTGSAGGFGRWQTELSVDGKSVADILISEGLAVKSSSRKTHNWCDQLAEIESPPKRVS
jgi:endonuclease YncB( thermonuclease family)